MTNLQLMLAIGIPTFTVLVGILLSRSDVSALRADIRSEIATLRGEMRSESAALRGEMISLRDSVHRDMVMLHERVAVVESKQR